MIPITRLTSVLLPVHGCSTSGLAIGTGTTINGAGQRKKKESWSSSGQYPAIAIRHFLSTRESFPRSGAAGGRYRNSKDLTTISTGFPASPLTHVILIARS